MFHSKDIRRAPAALSVVAYLNRHIVVGDLVHNLVSRAPRPRLRDKHVEGKRVGTWAVQITQED
jgi:hypothetical protein